MMGYHDLSAAGGKRVSTQDWAVREEAAQAEGLEGEAAGAAAVGGRIEPTRLRAMQRRWIQRKAGGAGGASGGGGASGMAGGGAATIPPGGGAPLGGGVQARMEKTLGADLSGVRVHTGGESAEAAESLGARAFTVSSDVHFGRGEFAPGSKEGDRLLAHELTHVVQGQKSGIQRKPAAADSDSGAEHGDHEAAGHEVSEPGDPAEQEADAMADHAAEKLHGAGATERGADAHAKPKIGAGAPAVGRKIFRADKKNSPSPGTGKKVAPTAPAQTTSQASAPKGGATTAPKAAPSPEEQSAERLAATVTTRLTSATGANLLGQVGIAKDTVKRLADSYPQNEKIQALVALQAQKLEAVKANAALLFTDLTAQLGKLPTTDASSYAAIQALRSNSDAVRYKTNPLTSDLPQVQAFAVALTQAENAVVNNHQKACADAESMIKSAPLDDTGIAQVDHAMCYFQMYWEGKLGEHAGAAGFEKRVSAAANSQKEKIFAEEAKKQQQQQQQGATVPGSGQPTATNTASTTSAAPKPVQAHATSPIATPASSAAPATAASTPASSPNAAATKPAAAATAAPAQPKPTTVATPPKPPAAAMAMPAQAPSPSSASSSSPPDAAHADPAAAPDAKPAQPDASSTPTPGQAPAPAGAQAAVNAGVPQAQQQAAQPGAPAAAKQKTPEELAVEEAEARFEVLAASFVNDMSTVSTGASFLSLLATAALHFKGGFIVAAIRQLITLSTKLEIEKQKALSIELIKQLDPASIDQLLKDFEGDAMDTLEQASERVQRLFFDSQRAKAKAAGKGMIEQEDAASDEMYKAEGHAEKEAGHEVVHELADKRKPWEGLELSSDLIEILEGSGKISLEFILEHLPELLEHTLIPGFGTIMAVKSKRENKKKLKEAKEKLEAAKKARELAAAASGGAAPAPSPKTS